jgi:hypothetical protein
LRCDGLAIDIAGFRKPSHHPLEERGDILELCHSLE